MKTFVFAAIAALSFGTAVSADDFDNNLLTTTVTTGNLEFSASTSVDSSLDGFGDNYLFGAKATVFTYTLGEGTSDVNVYGAFGEFVGDEFGVLGAEYVWTTSFDTNTTLELTGNAAYVMFDDFDNGDLVLTPSAELAIGLGSNVTVFGGAGYSWDTTNDFNQLGGYGELGLDIIVTDIVSVRTSVIQPFDTMTDDLLTHVEVGFNF